MSSTSPPPEVSVEEVTEMNYEDDMDDSPDNRGVVGGGFLAVDNSELNSHTYIYDANKSLRGMTLEALPSEGAYRDLMSLQEQIARPTIEDLRGENMAKKAAAEAAAAADQEDAEEGKKELKGKVVKFGWIEGVFMRCLLNIWGVMLFLRLTWVIGQCGIFQGIMVITVCNIVTSITAISMSAVSTNGMIKGGGIYYMISRSLGPEFGGAIGIMFTVANSIAVATYLIGFCDSLIDMIYEYDTGFNGIVSTNRVNDIRLVGAITLVFILALAVVGMEWVTRVQIGLLFLLIASQIDFLIGAFFPTLEEKAQGFVGFDAKLFSDNLMKTNFHDYENPDKPPAFFDVFGVFFPAVTGIVAGANLSGDLKNPAVSIPKGTLLAIIVTYISYVTYGMIIGACYLPEASGNLDEYWAAMNGDDSLQHFDNCTARECIFGSSNDQQTMSKISYTGFLVYAGCFAATLSSAIASLVGAPRVLQALARDKLYPLIGFFGVGYGANDDPFRGYILVFFIAFGCTMIGNLDLVSNLLSNFFVAAYALINFSVFHATFTKSPGWRPSFKYYNPWISLLGTVFCVVVMFLMDPITAFITFGCVILLYLYIAYRKPDVNWGSSTQAQQFVSTLRNIQQLNEVQDHVKNYRPKVLVFTGIPAHRPPLVDFANLITKTISLLICADVEKEPLRGVENLKQNVTSWMKDHKVKAFYSVTHAKTFEEGALNIMNLSGLGKMSPNMILLGYKNDWQTDVTGTQEYLNVIHHGFDLRLAIGVLRSKKGMDFSQTISHEERIRPKEMGKAITNEEEGKVVKKNGKSGEFAGGYKGARVVYHGMDGAPLPKHVINDITHFQIPKIKGTTIDVWWLYDDGGLTLLIPYILTTRSQYQECQLRVFALANRKDELDRETRNMASLLAKFRIDFSGVTVIPDVTKKAQEETKMEFKELLSDSKETVSDSELLAQKEKTNRHLRLSELLREHSKSAELVIMTLPMPRKGSTSNALYMSWLEIMTKDMPPFLLVRGNQTSVLTFYS